jgi:multiple sugar transport system ATP-binding protein
MNLIPGKLKKRNASWTFEYQDHQIEVSSDQESKPRDGDVILGIRPEDVDILPGGETGIAAEVLTVELLGQNYLILLKVDETTTISCLTKMKEIIHDGDRITLGFTPGKAHLFDPDTKQRI